MAKEKRKMKYSEATYERAGGGEEAKPHSTKEGRIAAGKREIRRWEIAQDKLKQSTKPKALAGGGIASGMRRFNRGGKV